MCLVFVVFGSFACLFLFGFLWFLFLVSLLLLACLSSFTDWCKKRLLWTAAAAGKQSLESSFWLTWALIVAQRRRRTVFREQFLALNWGPARRQVVFRDWPTWAFEPLGRTGARRGRQTVFRPEHHKHDKSLCCR